MVRFPTPRRLLPIRCYRDLQHLIDFEDFLFDFEAWMTLTIGDLKRSTPLAMPRPLYPQGRHPHASLFLRRCHPNNSAYLKRATNARFGSKADISQRNRYVRFGSKADICTAPAHVRFTPESGHLQCSSQCPLWANSGPRATYSITSSARPIGVFGTLRPSALAVLRLITNSYFVGA